MLLARTQFGHFQEIQIAQGSPIIWKDRSFKNQSYLVGLVPNDQINFQDVETSNNLMMNLQHPKAVNWLIKNGGKNVKRCNKDKCECGISDVDEKSKKPEIHPWHVTISINWKVKSKV